nr:lytic polysaccharide monooxygenase [Kibdelosporangium sp. MJ126-NF4]CEL14038.1 Chitin binding protein [Kibdelosporangium sp. MJ126-NF4]CTQ88404.1 Chitin binding protein [Kibdelosporangium sp. MJ126-NF4]
MTTRRSTARAALVGIGMVALSLLIPVTPASAHGSMSNPTSRIYNCWRENPEAPKTAACKAAIAAGDSWPVYDWDEVNQPNANGQHKKLIPDGKLCSAGRAKYQGFDLPRADWVATKLPTSGTFTFRYAYTAAHPGLWELYVTNNSYDPTRLLRWSDLEPTPFYRQMNPPVSGGAYQMTAQIPAGKTGRHLIYAIWQRQLPDSGEAFYSCSDVTF